ncbi:MAG: ABC transporter substrate-binding protein [Geminicoccaceae bacterium]
MHTPAYWQNPDRPTLHPWHLTTAYGSSERVVAERNPYYWKVDEKGQQLPYLDRITWDQMEDTEAILLKAFNGEIDFRKGGSHAMNRQEIIDLIYLGSGRPAQTAPQPASGFYDEEWATQFTEYHPDLAHEYLDKAGLVERDDEGFRLGPRRRALHPDLPGCRRVRSAIPGCHGTGHGLCRRCRARLPGARHRSLAPVRDHRSRRT